MTDADRLTAYLQAIKELAAALAATATDHDGLRATIRQAWNAYDDLSHTERSGVLRPDETFAAQQA